MTINRAILSLEKQGLIHVGNYNQFKYDRTRWFSLNFERLSHLKSITIADHVTGSSQNVTGPDQILYQNDTGSNQNNTGLNQNDTRQGQDDTGSSHIVTTIPKTTTEKTTEITSKNTAVYVENILSTDTERNIEVEHNTVSLVEDIVDGDFRSIPLIDVRVRGKSPQNRQNSHGRDLISYVGDRDTKGNRMVPSYTVSDDTKLLAVQHARNAGVERMFNADIASAKFENYYKHGKGSIVINRDWDSYYGAPLCQDQFSTKLR